MDAAQKDRMKYLFREILGVDVDQIVKQVVAKVSIERAKQVERNSKVWKRYMTEEGGIIILPSSVAHAGRKSPKP